MKQSVVPKIRLTIFVSIAFAGVLALAFFFLWPKYKFKEISKELDGKAMMDSVNNQLLNSIFEALRQFKNDNEHLPPEDNKSAMEALSGKNKSGKNYITGWNSNTFGFQGVLLDVGGQAVVFHFINDNEITIYCPGTKQLFDGFVDSDKASVKDQ